MKSLLFGLFHRAVISDFVEPFTSNISIWICCISPFDGVEEKTVQLLTFFLCKIIDIADVLKGLGEVAYGCKCTSAEQFDYLGRQASAQWIRYSSGVSRLRLWTWQFSGVLGWVIVILHFFQLSLVQGLGNAMRVSTKATRTESIICSHRTPWEKDERPCTVIGMAEHRVPFPGKVLWHFRLA